MESREAHTAAGLGNRKVLEVPVLVFVTVSIQALFEIKTEEGFNFDLPCKLSVPSTESNQVTQAKIRIFFVSISFFLLFFLVLHISFVVYVVYIFVFYCF